MLAPSRIRTPLLPPPVRTALRGGLRAGLTAGLAVGLLAGFSAGPAAAQDFTSISLGPATATANDSRSVNWIDYDGDGDLDLFVSNAGAGQPNQLFRNDAGTFVAIAGDPIVSDNLRDVGASWADADNDGDLDAYATSWFGQDNGLWYNDGDGTFTEDTTSAVVLTSSHTESCNWVDFDADGDLDLFLANAGQNAGSAEDNDLFRNDAGTFVALTTGPVVQDGLLSRHGAWGDYDDDGDLDLFVVNEAGQNNRLYRNRLVENNIPFFEEVTTAGPLTSDGGQSFGASWGDIDNDGDLDLAVANFDAENNFLYLNQLTETGTATFVAVTDQDFVLNRGYGISTSFADWDNDGDLDLMMTNAFATLPNRTRKNFLYRNDGGVLVRQTDTSDLGMDEGWCYGAAWADYDDDGDLDVFTARCFVGGEANTMYRNNAEGLGNHWLRLCLTGTDSNPQGIGARLRALATIDGTPTWQRRDVESSHSYCGQNLEQHFGFGDATVVDSLEIRWPSGTVQVLTNVAVDQKLLITEPSGATDVGLSEAATGVELAARPNPFRASTTIQWQQPEAATVAVSVHDVTGRVVRRFAPARAAAGGQQLVWDGNDAAGLPTAPGVYFVRMIDQDSVVGAARVTRLR